MTFTGTMEQNGELVCYAKCHSSTGKVWANSAPSTGGSTAVVRHGQVSRLGSKMIPALATVQMVPFTSDVGCCWPEYCNSCQAAVSLLLELTGHWWISSPGSEVHSKVSVTGTQPAVSSLGSSPMQTILHCSYLSKTWAMRYCSWNRQSCTYCSCRAVLSAFFSATL